MTIVEMNACARQKGWKAWGAFRKYGNSSYQCFRKKNAYVWIGIRYIERFDEPEAIDYVTEPERAMQYLQ